MRIKDKNRRVHLILGTRFGEKAEEGREIGKQMAANTGEPFCFAHMTTLSSEFLAGLVEGYQDAGGSQSVETRCANLVDSDRRKLRLVPTSVC